MGFKEDIVNIGKEILGRDLTEAEVEEVNATMEARYSDYEECFGGEIDIKVLFDEDFYDNLKEVISEVVEQKRERYLSGDEYLLFCLKVALIVLSRLLMYGKIGK